MKEQDQQIAIAEFCGWKWYRLPIVRLFLNHKIYRGLFHPILTDAEGRLEVADGSENICNLKYMVKEGKVPNYLYDINAIREALLKLTPEQMSLFDKHLAEIPEVGYSWLATASQLSEALVKTIGKWKD